jgi:hypothetical protein
MSSPSIQFTDCLPNPAEAKVRTAGTIRTIVSSDDPGRGMNAKWQAGKNLSVILPLRNLLAA